MRAAILAVFCAIVWLVAASAAPKPAMELSDADEIRIGQALAEQFAKSEGLQPTPQVTEIEAYLQSVGDRVAAHAKRKLPYKFYFDPNPAFRSAFGLPGGVIFVGGGILAMSDTEDQLAMVLGHEVEHVDLNQCRERLIAELEKAKLTPAQGDRLKIDPFLPGYGHDNEFAADVEGTKLASAAGYSPEAGARLLKMFVIMGQEMTHTESEADANLKARIAQIQKLIAEEKLATPKERPLALP
jgi:predicted Zn-dependent protease